MRQPSKLLWLCVFCVLCVCNSFVRAESDLELVTKIDTAVTKAVKFLASKQSPDGAWRSDVYAPFKEGDALTPLVMTALLSLPIGTDTEEVCERGTKYLAELSKRTFEGNDGLKSLAYPVYTAANITIALHQNRRAEDEPIRAKWVQALRDLQLTEATGWLPGDIAYGGWGYGHFAPKRPAIGQLLGPLDQPNMSATVVALLALRSAGVASDDPAVKAARTFIKYCQNETPQIDSADGGFYFIRDPVRNKAGQGGQIRKGTESFNSYGTPTADGLCALINIGDEAGGEIIGDAVRWIAERFVVDTVPGSFNTDRLSIRNGTYFYYCSSCSEALLRLAESGLALRRVNVPDWAHGFATELLRRQDPTGNWQNEVVDQREDDPIVATAFAVQALKHCRLQLSRDQYHPSKQGQENSLTFRACDAKCNGERLRYEPQAHKNTLGYWVNEKDWASWKIAVEKPGEFEVIVWQGCGAGQGGSEVLIGVGDESVTFTVEDTGHFQHFKKRSVGTLKFASAGTHELTLKCIHKAKDAVADVRQIQLVPVKAE